MAENSQRNFVSYAALLGAVHDASKRPEGVHPALFFSQDFTRLVMGEDPKDWQWLPIDWDEVEGLPTGVERTEKRIVAVSVQACLSANGGNAPFLIYIKAPSMPKGQQQKIQLQGVGASLHPSEFSWLVVDSQRKVFRLIASMV